MPRIDPIQLLKCLTVLLSSDGGIKSEAEVGRLVSLMAKYSKKLVSKCIYIQILKSSNTELLGSFMASGGWLLTHSWLTDGIVAKNWPLVQEVLELLLLSPTDIDRLKTNNFPKLVKELSRDQSLPIIRTYANKLVRQWLKVVKRIPSKLLTLEQLPLVLTSELDDDDDDDVEETRDYVQEPEAEEEADSDKNAMDVQSDSEEPSDVVDAPQEKIPPLKIVLKDRKTIVSEVSDRNKSDSDKKHSDRKSSKDKDKENDSSKRRDSDSSRSSSGSSKHSSSKSSSSSSSRHKSSDRHKSSSSSSKSGSSSSRSKDRSSSSSSSKSSSSSRDKEKSRSEREKEKISFEKALTQADKNKETLEKLQPPSIAKVGKIPKKSSADSKSAVALKEDPKKEKPSISIEVRKPNDPNRPKTVKTFNSKFRSTGLEQETKPPPPRNAITKKPVPLPTTITKRPSTLPTDAPIEKKPKVMEIIDKPGAIKLIPPKPKPAFLLESDMFMDALTASATTRKEPKKKKRRLSGSKDPAPNDLGSPPTSPDLTPTPSSATNGEEVKPFKFYQDTLDSEDEEKSKVKPEEPEVEQDIKTPKEVEEDDEDQLPPMQVQKVVFEDDEEIRGLIDLDMVKIEPVPGLKSALSRHKRKEPKKKLRWRCETDLVEIKYFELDENERVNVLTKFTDMQHMERVHEREAFQKARNLPNDDLMEERTIWHKLIPIDVPYVEYGVNSKEKDIQAAREKTVFPCIYSYASAIPDSPAEADPESYVPSETAIIPLDDLTGNPDAVCDFQETTWPEPKGYPPQNPTVGMNPMYPMGFGPPGFNNPHFNMPGFQPPPGGPNMMPMAPDGPNMGQDMGFMGHGPGMFGPPGSGPMGQFPMMDNMNGFPGPMGNPGGPMGNPGGPMNNQGGMMGPRPMGPHFRGGMRGGPPPRGGWRGGGRGGPPIRPNTRVCIHFQNKGFCRLAEKCQYLHPGVNCPF